MITSVLSDGTIRRLVAEGRIVIKPWEPARVQPASVDLLLGDSFRVFHNHRVAGIDLREPPQGLTEEVTLSSGESFVIHPGEFCLGRTLEWVELPDDVVARIEGKALAIDTPVPTPNGWRTMGDLRVGDHVFGADGAPTPVVAVSEVMTGRDCREVVFSDGITIIADDGHQWEVLTRTDRSRGLPPRVKTTGEIADALEQGDEYNHHVVQAAPVQYPERDLPIDPYVLGAWLGDGTSTKGVLTTVDEPILEEIAGAGYDVRPASGRLAYAIGAAGSARDAGTRRFMGNDSLHSRLRALGALGNKQIPQEYMQSAVHQRAALLQGLMDTDGYVDVYGRCELTTVRGPLANQYFELIASLGYKPHLSVKTARIDGRACSLAFLNKFTPHEPVFRLPRKLARQKLGGRFYMNRAIVDVRPTESVPVRCIEVGSARGVYLVTEAFVPTHNSSLGRLGLIVHATAGFIDPGWKGTLTLELNNLTRVPIRLHPGLPIAQLSFMALDQAAERPYGSPELGSHYQGQVAATESRYMR